MQKQIQIVRVITYDDRRVSVRWTDQDSVGAHLASALRRLGFVETATGDINRLVRQLSRSENTKAVITSVFQAALEASEEMRFETKPSSLPGPEPTNVSYAPRRSYDKSRLEPRDPATTTETN